MKEVAARTAIVLFMRRTCRSAVDESCPGRHKL